MEMFNQNKPVKKPSEDCEIEVKNTKSGKKIRISGKCSREDLKLFTHSKELGEEDI